MASSMRKLLVPCGCEPSPPPPPPPTPPPPTPPTPAQPMPCSPPPPAPNQYAPPTPPPPNMPPNQYPSPPGSPYPPQQQPGTPPSQPNTPSGTQPSQPNTPPSPPPSQTFTPPPSLPVTPPSQPIGPPLSPPTHMSPPPNYYSPPDIPGGPPYLPITSPLTPYTPNTSYTAPPPSNHHNRTIIITACSVGGFFFLAFLLTGLLCFKKRYRKHGEESEMVEKMQGFGTAESAPVHRADGQGPINRADDQVVHEADGQVPVLGADGQVQEDVNKGKKKVGDHVEDCHPHHMLLMSKISRDGTLEAPPPKLSEYAQGVFEEFGPKCLRDQIQEQPLEPTAARLVRDLLTCGTSAAHLLNRIKVVEGIQYAGAPLGLLKNLQNQNNTMLPEKAALEEEEAGEKATSPEGEEDQEPREEDQGPREEDQGSREDKQKAIQQEIKDVQAIQYGKAPPERTKKLHNEKKTLLSKKVALGEERKKLEGQRHHKKQMTEPVTHHAPVDPQGRVFGSSPIISNITNLALKNPLSGDWPLSDEKAAPPQGEED